MAVYGSWVQARFDDYFTGATLKAMLLTSDYTQNHADLFRDDLVDEISGTGYTSGGVALTGVGWSVVDGSIKLVCDLIDFGTVDAPDIGAIVFYVDNGSAATDSIFASDPFDAPLDASGGIPLTYTPAADGIFIGDFTV